MNKKENSILDTFQNRCLRRILGIRWPDRRSQIIQKDRSATSQQGSKEKKTEVDRACFKDATERGPYKGFEMASSR